MNWLRWIFDSSDFITRNHCGRNNAWGTELIAIYQLVHLITAIAYFSIPLSLVGLWLKLKTFKILIKRNIAIVIMFSIFIFFCGLAHIMNVVSFYYAPYRLFTVIDTITATASILTAIFLPAIIYDVINFIQGIEDDSGKK